MARTRDLVFSPKRMRKARLRRNWSQADLARETRETEGNVGRWERGEVRPPGDFVAVMARATGHSIEFFYVEAAADEEEEEAARVGLASASLETALTDLARAALKRAAREEVGAS